MKLDKKWWIGLIVPSVIALGVGYKAEIAGQFSVWWTGLSGWWTALTPWRFLFWGSVMWIAGWLVARLVYEIRERLKAYDEVIANFAKALFSVNERLQATEMKLGIYPGDKKGG